jgi:hypothetical protein
MVETRVAFADPTSVDRTPRLRLFFFLEARHPIR